MGEQHTPERIALRRDGQIWANGSRIGRYQRLTFGGYDVELFGQKLGANYRADIEPMARAAIAKAEGR